MPIKIITTEDGSHSLYDEALNETYHSTRGALGESQHVFIREGLQFYAQAHPNEPIHILEVGFGTGLNALLSAVYANQHNLQVAYTSLEPYPIQKETFAKLNHGKAIGMEELFNEIQQSGWGDEIDISDHFALSKLVVKLEDYQTTERFHVVYFDAFAPSKQPDVWSVKNLRTCHDLLHSGGILTTYCAQGQFKRNLSEAGFKVETLPGAMGKKEMIRAIKA